MSTKDEVARLERELANMALDAKQVRDARARAMMMMMMMISISRRRRRDD